MLFQTWREKNQCLKEGRESGEFCHVLRNEKNEKDLFGNTKTKKMVSRFSLKSFLPTKFKPFQRPFVRYPLKYLTS